MDWTIVDSEGKTFVENAKFYITGFKGEEFFHGVVVDVIDPDEGEGVRIKVKFADGETDYLPCYRRDQDSEIFICDEITVET